MLRCYKVNVAGFVWKGGRLRNDPRASKHHFSPVEVGEIIWCEESKVAPELLRNGSIEEVG